MAYACADIDTLAESVATTTLVIAARHALLQTAVATLSLGVHAR